MEPPTQGEEYDDEGDAGEEAESTSAAAGGQTEVAGQQIEYEMLDESVAKQQQQETMEQDWLVMIDSASQLQYIIVHGSLW